MADPSVMPDLIGHLFVMADPIGHLFVMADPIGHLSTKSQIKSKDRLSTIL